MSGRVEAITLSPDLLPLVISGPDHLDQFLADGDQIRRQFPDS